MVRLNTKNRPRKRRSRRLGTTLSLCRKINLRSRYRHLSLHPSALPADARVAGDSMQTRYGRLSFLSYATAQQTSVATTDVTAWLDNTTSSLGRTHVRVQEKHVPLPEELDARLKAFKRDDDDDDGLRDFAIRRKKPQPPPPQQQDSALGARVCWPRRPSCTRPLHHPSC